MIGFIDNLYIYNSGLQEIKALQLFPHFTVDRYTLTRVLSLH
jgi:hypothetical protein